jgi:Tol biopolymer transport system component
LIVFDSNRNRLPSEPGNTSDLFLMNTDGTHQKLLTRGSSATWSPNGKYIASQRSASGTGLPIRIDPGAPTADSDIFIMRVPDFDGDVIEESINITNTSRYIEEDADWSPDGQKIVSRGTVLATIPRTRFSITRQARFVCWTWKRRMLSLSASWDY